MKEELEAKLREAAPTLYRDTDIHQKHKPEPTNFSFECGDGWFDFLMKASVEIEALNQQQLAAGVPLEHLTKAAQVKEKFATLRFYVDSHTEEVDAIISAAEAASEVTCERCGKPGRRRGRRWLYTACTECTKPEDLEVP